jgi:hypothetical protein
MEGELSISRSERKKKRKEVGMKLNKFRVRAALVLGVRKTDGDQ